MDETKGVRRGSLAAKSTETRRVRIISFLVTRLSQFRIHASGSKRTVAQMLPIGRRHPGGDGLLVLGSVEIAESLRGYLTIYDSVIR